jgi:two-component system, NarL family, sensor kinase
MWYARRARFRNDLAAKEQQLQQQRITELEQQNKLLALSAMLEGQEAERMRIARDLHDGIGGLLTTIKAYFNSLPHPPEEIQNPELYNKTNDLINEACVEVRRVAHNLVPQTLSLSGLQGTIEDLGEHLEAQGLKCDIVVEGIPHNVDQTKGIMIYRILQELANNILKHAEASNVLLQAIVYEDTLNLLVEDNGKGFDTSQVSDGQGLQNVQWRVNFLRGTMEYESTPGVGTTVTIGLPLTGLHILNGRKLPLTI